ncbi:MAG: Crp/Fnr family transcriptional regulator [Lachnospiraceae bacterium]|nr:Crp/Fnr family transcriptional regulator [Lachnospiraceae bacterium]
MIAQKDLDFIRTTAFFRGLGAEDLAEALRTLRAAVKTYDRGELILHAGEPTERMGLVLSGSVTIESNDLWGTRTILSHAGPGEFFAETYAMLPGEVLLVDAAANEDCRILFLNMTALRGDAAVADAALPDAAAWPDAAASPAKKGSGSWRGALIRNLLHISFRKNLILSGRAFHTAPHAVRARVMSYLNTMALRSGSNTFEIPFDRQQMADYLNVERTALSKELGRMRDDGLISFRKNRFTLHGEV